MNRIALLVCALAAFGWIASPEFATTRYASPGGAPEASECTSISAPCSLDTALTSAQDGDSLSLAGGTYDVTPKDLPPVALHWLPTDPQTRPVISSTSQRPTLALTTAAQSGTSFDHLEIDNMVRAVEAPAISPRAGAVLPSALQVGPGVAATVSSSVITGPSCIVAPDAGALEIDDSTLNATFPATCLNLNAHATVRRSAVGRALPVVERTLGDRGVIVPDPPVLITQGLVEDSTITGGLGLSGPTSVARRVRASGAVGIAGQGLVVDSLAQGSGFQGAAIEAETDRGGTLLVIGSTAVGSGAPALLSGSVGSDAPVTTDDLVVSNSIARSDTTDIVAEPVPACALGGFCERGLIHIDHSDFATRSPLAGDPQAALITQGAGNVNGDPLFAKPLTGDFHLRAGSPAIDAGAMQDPALPTDLDGRSRSQGRAPDLGAFETTPPGGSGSGGPGIHSAGGGHVPLLSRLHVTPARFRIGGHGGGTTIAFRLDTASSVTLTLQRVVSGHRRGKLLPDRPEARQALRAAALGRAADRPDRPRRDEHGAIPGPARRPPARPGQLSPDRDARAWEEAVGAADRAGRRRLR